YVEDAAIDDFHVAAYNAAQGGRSWGGATYMGVKTWKWPCDLHLYAELVWELKPRLIIETGTAFGGSALYFAHLLDAIGSGKVISIDLKPVENSYPRHPRIAYIGGHSSPGSTEGRGAQPWDDRPGRPQHAEKPKHGIAPPP